MFYDDDLNPGLVVDKNRLDVDLALAQHHRRCKIVFLATSGRRPPGRCNLSGLGIEQRQLTGGFQCRALGKTAQLIFFEGCRCNLRDIKAACRHAQED